MTTVVARCAPYMHATRNKWVDMRNTVCNMSAETLTTLELARNIACNSYAAHGENRRNNSGPELRPDMTAQTETLERQRRQQVCLDKLAQNPVIRHALVMGDPNADPVIISMAIRGVGVMDLAVQKSKWAPFLFLHIMDQQQRPN